MANSTRFDHDPKDTWQRRRAQSAKDRYGVKPPEPPPRPERVVAPPVTGRYSSTGVSWGLYPTVKFKFSPGDLVEVWPSHPEYSRYFNDYDSLVVDSVGNVFGSASVRFVGETCTIGQDALRLRDGPW